MMWYRKCRLAVLAGTMALAIGWSGSAASAPAGVTVEIDENGNATATGIPGTTGPTSLPHFGGVGTSSPLTYNLSALTGALQPGTLLITESCEEADGDSYCVISDVIQFLNVVIGGVQTPILEFFSDNTDGADALADTGLPFVGGSEIFPCGTRSSATECFMPEIGPEGNNGVTYTPVNLVGGGPPYTDPGFFTSHAVTYIIHSDTPAVVPEPATLTLLGIGLAGLGFARRARKQ